MANRWENNRNNDRVFSWAPKSLDDDCSHEIKLAPWKKSYDKPRQHIKKQRYRFADKDMYNQRYTGFSSSHEQI